MYGHYMIGNKNVGEEEMSPYLNVYFNYSIGMNIANVQDLKIYDWISDFI